MKKELARLLLYFYERFIIEDWDEYTILGKICLYPVWIMRIIYLIPLVPILAPIGYYWENSLFYSELQKMQL